MLNNVFKPYKCCYEYRAHLIVRDCNVGVISTVTMAL